MPFDWRQYLKLARVLARHRGDEFGQEAAFRSAVSRAYYVALCHAVEYARTRLGYRPSYTGKDHREIRNHLVVRGMSDFAESLYHLDQWRATCDYRPAAPPSFSLVVESAISRAEQVFDRLQ
jgi:hypothetical protein